MLLDVDVRVGLPLRGAALPRRVEQVVEYLVVDLEVRARHQELELGVGGVRVGDPPEHLLVHLADDAGVLGRARHRERLARPRLPVREDRAVPPLERLVEQRRAQVVVDGLLDRVVVVRVVEGELARRRALLGRLDRRVPVLLHRDDLGLLLVELALVHRPAAHRHHHRRRRFRRRALLDDVGGLHERARLLEHLRHLCAILSDVLACVCACAEAQRWFAAALRTANSASGWACTPQTRRAAQLAPALERSANDIVPSSWTRRRRLPPQFSEPCPSTPCATARATRAAAPRSTTTRRAATPCASSAAPSSRRTRS